MRLLNSAGPSSFEEIKTWYPVWYRDVFEMETIWRAFGFQFDRIRADIIRAVDNNFIEYADAQAIQKIENHFDISHSSPRTIEERRAIIRGFVQGRGRVGRAEIAELFSIFTNNTIEVTFSRPGRIHIAVSKDIDDDFTFDDIKLILNNRLPAHLEVIMSAHFNPNHEAADYSGGAISELITEYFYSEDEDFRPRNNRHIDLSQFTNEELSKFTHEQLQQGGFL